MGTARTRCIALTGLDGQVVEITAETAAGPPGLTLLSVAEPGMWETRDRVRAAVVNSAEAWPDQRLTITFTGPYRRDSRCDLAIAVAVLAAAGTVPTPPLEVVLLGELGLDGRLRPVRGVLPAVRTAAAAGCAEVIVPQDNAAEAALIPGIRVTGADTLAAVAAHLRGAAIPASPASSDGELVTQPAASRYQHPAVLAGIAGQQSAKHAAEVCAAGGHHLLLTGPAGVGKVLVAERVCGLLAPLEPVAALDVTALHSLAGLLAPGDPLISQPPFICPHHTTSKAAMLGGGSRPMRPGAVSLAHHGVLCLEEAPEFDRDVLAALSRPLATGQIELARAGQITRFPAAFTLVMTARPCPCSDRDQICGCTPAARQRYLGRLAGPLTSRIDLIVSMPPRPRVCQASAPGSGEPDSAAIERAAAARRRAARRLIGTPWRLNAQVPGDYLRRRFRVGLGVLAELNRAVELGQLSVFSAGRVLAVAWTLADLAGEPRPGPAEVTAALELRLGTGA